MANLLDSIVKGYTTGMNNQLNAQKAYIDSYITGINARNAVNQEARTKDQYWNYTQPLQASNLSVIIPQNQTQADFYGDPNVRRQQLAIANQVLGNQYGMSQTEGSLLPTYQRIRVNDVNTSDQNAIYNYDQSKANRAMQADNNATAAYKAKASLGMAKDINNLRSVQIQQELNDINNSNPTGTATDGTTNTDVPTTIMLPNGGKTPTGMFGTDGRLNFTGTTTTPASGLPSNPSNTQQTGQQTGQVNLNSNPYYQNYSADQLQSALGNLTSSTDSILGSTPDILLSHERRARKIAFNQNYELMIQARDAKLAEQKAQQQIENQAYLKRLTDKALASQRTNSGLK